jgi:glycosyltransferase involved in cell wall biosynthesis
LKLLRTGAVPVVADFGGPGDIVHPEVGYKVPLTNESDIVAQMEKILTESRPRSESAGALRQQGMAYARECLTWEAKAQDTLLGVLNWVTGARSEARFSCPPKA